MTALTELLSGWLIIAIACSLFIGACVWNMGGHYD